MDRSAPPIALEPRAATPLRIALGVVVVLALVALTLTRLPLWAQALAALLVLAQGVLADRTLRRMSAMRLALRADGAWLARDAAGDRVLALRDYALVGPLVAMRFEAEPRDASRILLLPGMVAPDTLRALRVWLRHGYTPR